MCKCANDEMLTDKLTYARLSGLNAHAHGCRHPLISAVAATLPLLAALSILDILDQPNLDGLDLAHQYQYMYLRDSARRAQVASAASVPRLDAAGSKVGAEKSVALT